MVFSSTIFLFSFLPVVFLLHLILPGMKAKNLLLVLASLVFYAFGEPYYVAVMFLSALANYGLGLFAGKGGQTGRTAVAAAVIFNIGVIGIFKYADFVLQSVNQLLHTDFPLPGIPLPVGISFFTFQALSYVIDAYRDRDAVSKSFSQVLLYICFFPQLVAGPIIKYDDIRSELARRTVCAEEAALGIRRFICGMAKKLLIANTMGGAADQIFALDDVNIALAWLGGLAYLFQIYFDFSGYSDMAIGLGRMFGFHYKENFNYPYVSTSIKEFWRRWHISLSSWFRDYLYIPLGGNRKGRTRTWINKYVVFFATGLWHGANWTFVLWGLIHGTFSVLEDSGVIPASKWQKGKGRIIGHIYTMVVVTVAFVLFRADTVGQGFFMIKEMFAGFHFEPALRQEFLLQLSPMVILAFVLAVILSMPVAKKLQGRKTEGWAFAGSLALLGLCILNLSAGTFNPFIYFRF